MATLVLPEGWYYALPLAGYMLAIVYLFYRLVPAAVVASTSRLQHGAPRQWELAATGQDSVVHGQLKGVTRRHIVLATADGQIRRVPLETLTAQDRTYVVARSKDRYFAGSAVFLVLAALSLAATWSFMLQYFVLSSYDHAARTIRPHLTRGPLSTLGLLARPSSKHWSPFLWLRDVSLFDEAWSTVCATPARWLLSSQLCLFAVAVFTPLLLTTTLHRPSSHPRQGGSTSLLVLGQIVAISVATALFFRLPRRPSIQVSLLLWPSLILATAATGLLPHVISTPRFLPVLLIMHILLFLPLFPSYRVTRRTAHLRELYIFLAVLSTLIHLKAVTDFFGSTYTLTRARDAVDAFWAHPAQGSIGSDALACTAIWLVYLLLEGSYTSALVSVMGLPVMGLGGIAAGYLALRERKVLKEIEGFKLE